MAGVVASTLRRKAFKKSGAALYPVAEGKGQQSLEFVNAATTTTTSTIISSSATYSPTTKTSAVAGSSNLDGSSSVSEASSILGSPTSPFISTPSSSSASDHDDETSRFCPKRKEKKAKTRLGRLTVVDDASIRKSSISGGHKSKTSAGKSSKHARSNQRHQSVAEEKAMKDDMEQRINTRLCLVDFWPTSLTPYELNMDKVKLESFDMLIPKANIWLLENPDTHVIKCETIEKKVYNLDDVISQNVLFRPLVSSSHAFYIKGLRIWYVKIFDQCDPGFHVGEVKPSENETFHKPPEMRNHVTSRCHDNLRRCCLETRGQGHNHLHQDNHHHHQLHQQNHHQTQQQDHHQHHQCCGCCSLPDLSRMERLENKGDDKDKDVTEDVRSMCAYTPALDDPSLPLTIGYMNVIPRCIDHTSKYPVYEEVPETYSSVSTYLSEYPLEGKIVTIETVPLKLTNHRARQKPEIDPNQTFFPDAYLRHILYITRIYFRYGRARVEIIGAQDFLPDKDTTSSFYNFKPQYKGISSAVQKVQSWMKKIKNVSITNIQTLETAFRQSHADVRTGSNFLDKSESHSTVKFIRVTYTRPFLDLLTPSKGVPSSLNNHHHNQESLEIEALENFGIDNLQIDNVINRKSLKVYDMNGMFNNPANYKGFTYKTFVPAPVKVAMCSGIPEYEGFSSTMERSKIWLKCVNKHIISVESLTHPLSNIWNDQDGGEATVCHGEWTTSGRKKRKHLGRRRSLVYLVRVYLDGPYHEPSPHLIPPTPLVEEIKDCACLVM